MAIAGARRAPPRADRLQNGAATPGRAERAFSVPRRASKTRVIEAVMRTMGKIHIEGCGLPDVTDGELLAGIVTFVASERRMLGRFLRYLAAIDRRGLYRDAACSSLFDFCCRRLGLSEGETYYRITAARMAKRWPEIFELVETGRIHLTALVLLQPHLTDDNHGELLAAASGRTKQGVKELLAERFPRPDVAARLRKLPERRAPGSSAPDSPSPTPAGARRSPEGADPPPGPVLARAAAAAGSQPCALARAEAAAGSQPSALARAEAAAVPQPSALGRPDAAAPLPLAPALGRPDAATPLPLAPAPVAIPLPSPTSPSASAGGPRALRDRGRIEPLSAGRYRLELTASAALRTDRLRARDLMRQQNPTGDLGLLVERAVALLVADLEKKRLGKTARPRPTREASAAAIERAGAVGGATAARTAACEATAKVASARAVGGATGPGTDPREATASVPPTGAVGHATVPGADPRDATARVAATGVVGGATAPGTDPRDATARMAATGAVGHATVPGADPRDATARVRPTGADEGAPQGQMTSRVARRAKPTNPERVRAAVRRAVFERDGERCTFTDGKGRRCEERGWLQLDHVKPLGRGGSSDTDNVRVLCHAHNQLAAERVFGRAHVAHRRRDHLRQHE